MVARRCPSARTRNRCARRWPTSWPPSTRPTWPRPGCCPRPPRPGCPCSRPRGWPGAAAGARTLHVIGTTESFPDPVGQEVEVTGAADGLAWELRFFDPVVLPVLGLGAAADRPAPADA